MSHFPVLVIGDNVEGQLAPYNEDLNVEFEDCTEEMRQKAATKKIEVVIMPDGSWKYPNDSEFLNPDTKAWFSGGSQYLVPEGLKREERLLGDLYPDFATMAGEYFGYRQYGEVWGYWHNPQAKWDWYVVGGRWSGWLTNKAGRQVDCCPAGEVGWEAMLAQRRTDAQQAWDCWQSEHKGDPVMGWVLFGIKAGTTQEDYLREASALTPYALVKDGKWYAQGDVGFFGFTFNDKDCPTWQKRVELLLDSLPDDTMLTVVDCHI